MKQKRALAVMSPTICLAGIWTDGKPTSPSRRRGALLVVKSSPVPRASSWDCRPAPSRCYAGLRFQPGRPAEPGAGPQGRVLDRRDRRPPRYRCRYSRMRPRRRGLPDRVLPDPPLHHCPGRTCPVRWRRLIHGHFRPDQRSYRCHYRSSRSRLRARRRCVHTRLDPHKPRHPSPKRRYRFGLSLHR
jgi:hypothetical protein